MVFGDSKDAVNLNRSRSLPHVFSSISSPSREPGPPKKAGSLAKILSWFSIKERTHNVDPTTKKQKKRALHNLIAKLVKKGKKKGRVLNSSDAQFLCVPSLYLYERFSRSISSSRLNPSFISRRTASDANVSYKCSYEKAVQNCLIPLRDKVGCYYAVVVDGKQYSLGDFFVKATNEDDITSTPERGKLRSPEPQRHQVDAGEGISSMSAVKKELQPNDCIQLKNILKRAEFEPKKIISKSTKSRLKKCYERGDGISSKGKPDLRASPHPNVPLFSKGKYSIFQTVGKKPMQRSMISSRKQSWNTMDSLMDDEPSTQERIIVQNVAENARYRERSTSPGEQSSCCVLKKNSVHKTNLARLGTNMEAAHLKKLKAFIRTHRIDSGKLEFKERLALQWVVSKGGKMPSALETERKGRWFQDLSTHNAFFEPASPVRIEPPVSLFVPHFPQNRKFVYEVKPHPEPSNCRLPELRERHQEPQIISSFSQESLPLDSLFVPHAGPKAAQETVKMMSNLWDLRKEKQKQDFNVDRNEAKTESWNFKISK